MQSDQSNTRAPYDHGTILQALGWLVGWFSVGPDRQYLVEARDAVARASVADDTKELLLEAIDGALAVTAE